MKNKGNPTQISSSGTQKGSPPWMKGKNSNPQTERSNESNLKKEETEDKEERLFESEAKE